ncbi:hypothetical protein BC833DRAFT_601340 [Globomyces pollinis-pini]|nr:hypothetical protein BC833DRAFT_601340 [Globomyces pollinis-pini]
MVEITPSLPDGHLVRTYDQNYAGTDTESEGEAQFEVDAEDEEQFSTSTRLQQNQQYLDHQITPASSTWLLEPQTLKTNKGVNVILVRKPTASNLSHRLLNPFIYRNIENVGKLDALAKLLNTPDDWYTMYNQVVQDGYIFRKLKRFIELPENTSEASIQAQFSSIVSNMADRLGVDMISDSETKIIVGGLLARHEYDIRSKCDPHFLSADGVHLIASEVKTLRTFGPGEMWYHSSRGIQVLSALYAFNCPTFLFTQGQWKLFVENKARNTILTFPYDNDETHSPHVNSSLVKGMGKAFLKAIVICLLSKRESLVESMNQVSIEESSQVMQSPNKSIINPKYFDTLEKPQRQSTRLQKFSESKYGKKQPSFVSGYIDGQPLYTTVRILPQEVVSRIEDEITLQEKAEFNKRVK